MRKRFYILFVARNDQGELRKIPIPLHYAYVFLAGALIGMLSITGMVGSYGRMLFKVMRFNQVRAEKEQVKSRYSQLEQVARDKDIQVASLGSLASEVSAIYGLKTEPLLQHADPQARRDSMVDSSLNQFNILRVSAISGAATIGIGMGAHRPMTTADWLRLSQLPTLWPVVGRITSAFGERIDPFNGEGAYHRGVDISSTYGTPIVAPADGVVLFAARDSGYGRMIEIDHGQGVMTRYGHLSGFVVSPGQSVRRGEIIGYVGDSGRSTGPHLHYEVWLHDAPVNPYKYLRMTQQHLLTSFTD